MIRYKWQFWPLAACLAALAGYVDAFGFLKVGGFFVSFMSGNSTRLAVGLATGTAAAGIAGGLVAAFVAGVVAGSLLGAAIRRHRKPAILLLVAAALGGAGLADMALGDRVATFVLAFAMGAENAVFQRDGEVSIALTYITGTLVKLGQQLAAALTGGPAWGWLPYLILWASLTGGAVLGAHAYVHFAASAIWWAAGAALVLAGYAALIGQADRRG